jgi:hypothetical protein
MAVAKPGGGAANAQPLKGENGNLIKMILRNGTYHTLNPPRNYIVAVIVLT